MKYILKRRVSPEHLQGWHIEPCSPFEISEVVSEAVILFWKTAESLSDFFSHAGLAGWTLETLNYKAEFPDDFKPEDVVYFIYCPTPYTFQFWKGQKLMEG